MIRRDIRRVVRQIGEKYHPEKIILFGSRAYGKPTVSSDVDLLVIMDHDGSPRRQAAEILQNIDYHFGLDLIVPSLDQIHTRIKDGDYFLQEIVDKGLVLYERDFS
jgi:predicted nucleotidyltransferase